MVEFSVVGNTLLMQVHGFDKFWGEMSAITIFLGDGAGGLGTPEMQSAGTGVDGMIAADFNHDDKPDLAIADYNYNTVNVLLNSGP